MLVFSSKPSDRASRRRAEKLKSARTRQEVQPNATSVSEPEGQSARKLWHVFLGIWLAAFCLRCIYLWQLHSTAFFDLRVGDGLGYHLWAQRIAAGNWRGEGIFYQAPFYPYFLAVIYRFFGEGLVIVRLIQAAIGATSCALVAAAGVSLFGRLGIIAGIGMAIYPPAIVLDGLLEKSSFVNFFTSALIALLAVKQQNMSRRIWFAAGIILGLLVLTRENALILGIPVLYWILAVSFPGEWRKRLVAVGMFVGGCALVLFPVGLRNLAVGGEFHLTTSQFGPNFYIGNHAGADGTYQPLVAGHGSAADEREDSTRLAEQAAGHKLSPAEVSDFWTKRALDYIRSQPGAWLKLTARKLMLTFNAAELPDSESLEIYADTSWVLRLLNPFNFGVLLGLTVLCAMLVPGSWKRAGFLYVLIGIYALSVTLFYVFSRYRFPLVPMMMVLAAGGVAEMVTRLRQRRTQGLAVPVIAAVIAVLISHIPLHDSRGGWATHYTNFGNALARDTNRLEQAIGLYQRALDQLPQFPGAQYGIGLLLSRLNREGEAIPYYRAALASWPTFMEAHRALGKSLEAVGQSQEAAKELVEALRLSPDDALAHFAFAKTLASLNQLDLAVEHYKKGLSIQPKEVRGIVGLGVVFSQMGRSDEAIRNFQLALELIPQDTEALNNLGAVLANQGRLSEAIAYFERALSLDPKNEAAKKNLDMLRQSRPR